MVIRAVWLAFGWFWGAWSAVLPSVRDQAGLADSTLGLVLLAVPACAVPAMLVAGRLYDRFGTALLVAALLALGALAPMLGVVSSGVSLAIVLGGAGFASGAVDVALNTATVAVERKGFVQTAQAGFPVAGVLSGATSGLLLQWHVPLWTVLAIAGAALAATALAATRLRSGHRERVPGRLRMFPALWLLGGTAALALLVENAVQQWSAARMQSELGAGPAVAALAPAGFALGLFAGRMISGRTGWCTGLTPALLLAGGGGTAGLLLAAWAPVVPLALLGFIAAGIALAAAAPALFSSAGRLVPDGLRGQAVSRVSSIAYTGYFVGPVLVGASSTLGGLRAGLTAVAGCAALLLVAPKYMS